MLLVIDVGNTNTVLGVFARVAKVHAGGDAADPERYERLLANWRVATSRRSTVDEYGVLFRNLFSMAGLDREGFMGSSFRQSYRLSIRCCDRSANVISISIRCS